MPQHREASLSCVQIIVGVLLAAGLKGNTLSEGMGVAVIIMFCVFALGFAWWAHDSSKPAPCIPMNNHLCFSPHVECAKVYRSWEVKIVHSSVIQAHG